MKISQNTYNKLHQKNFYKFICGSALFDCFKHDSNNIGEIIDVKLLEDTLNKYKIFRYSTDDLDNEIFGLLHHEIHHGDTNFINLIKPSIFENKRLWLDSGQSINDILSDISIVESNVSWNALVN